MRWGIVCCCMLVICVAPVESEGGRIIIVLAMMIAAAIGVANAYQESKQREAYDKACAENNKKNP